MTEFSRLLDSSSNPELRALLESSLDDAPPPDALPKVATAIGVTAALLPAVGGAHSALVGGSALATANTSAAASVASGSTTAAVGSLAGSAGTAAATTGVLGTGMSLTMLGKTLMISMLSAGLATAGAIAVSETQFATPHTDVPGAVAPRATTPAPSVEESSARGQGRHEASKSDTPVDPDRDEAPSSAVAPIQPLTAGAAARSSTRPSVGASTSAVSRQQGNLSREVRQIDSAREALESKNASGALAELETYDRTRQSGALDREALLLRIEALALQQDFLGATALARDYLGRFPNDAHAPRLRALIAAHTTHVGSFPAE